MSLFPYKCAVGIGALAGSLFVAGGLLFMMPRQTPAGDGQTAAPPALDARISEHVKRMKDIIKEQEAAAKKAGRNFSSPSESETISKLTKGSDPMIQWQSWTSSAAPGGTISYTVGIYNPDSQKRFPLYAYLFVGPANAVPDAGTALGLEDPRFPRLTLPAFDGLALDPGASASLNFSVTIPNGVDKSNYTGNTFLSEVNYHGIGKHLDRSAFPFEVK